MKRTKLCPDLSQYPAEFLPLLEGTPLYDSSCSSEARVIFLDRGGGYYLKSALKGTLKHEAEMTRYFHSKGLATEVLSYLSGDLDWLLTRRVEGEDCTCPEYLQNPERLCDTLAALLRQLHDTPYGGCPVSDRMKAYRETAEANYRAGRYDADLFPDNWGFRSAEEAWKTVEEYGMLLKNDTLIHGDYCLPNVLLNHWQFSGLIDLGNGGVGDRHIDLFWGAWTLNFNLKTDRYRQRFFDAYGRENVDFELLRAVAAFEVFG